MADAITVSSVDAGTKTSGRNEDYWGNRRVALYRVTPDPTANVGGVSFDARKFGFDRPVAAVFVNVRYNSTDKNRYTWQYDATNKKLVQYDNTDNDDGNGDTIASVLDVLVISE